MRICSIASGSSGNCTYIGTDNTHILVDAGVSCKKIVEGLNALSLSPKDLDGIFITHEHIDHIAGLGVLSRKYGVPIYGTPGTIEGIKKTSSLGKIDADFFRKVREDEKLNLKDIEVHPFKISHDAAQPVGYRVEQGNKKTAVATDMGYFDDYIVENLKGVNALVLEANHDVNMLQVGPYPYYLKQRILGNRGHLSNENSGRLLCNILHDDLKAVTLGHLSKENNLPELAYETVRMEITMQGKYKADDFPIYVAKRSEISEIVEI